MSEIETYCAKQIKNYDYDRFLVTLFAPASARENLFALYAFNHEVAKIREAVSEPMLGEIRLQWWREAIEGIYENSPRNHEVVLPLHKAVQGTDIPLQSFIDIIDARAADIYDDNHKTITDFEDYLGKTSGNLAKLGAQIIGSRDETSLSLAYDMGLVWGLIGTIRTIRYHISLRKLSLPQDVMDQYGVSKQDIFGQTENENINQLIKDLCKSALGYLGQISQDKKQIDKDIRSLFLLSALSRSYLNMIEKAHYNPFQFDERAGMFQRQSRLFFSALFGLI